MGSSSGGSSSKRSSSSSSASNLAKTVLGGTTLGTAARAASSIYDRINNNVSSGGSSNQQGMVVPGTAQTSVKNTYNGQGYVDLLSNPQAQNAWPFKDVQAPNNQYVPLSDAVNAFNTTQPVAPEVPLEEPYDPTEYINQMKEAQRASRIASLDKAKSAALSSLDTEKANVAPTYYDKRNQAAAASDVGAMNFAQYMAARGIKDAAGAMPEVYRQAGLQGQIGALDRQEASDMAGIERQRSNVESGYASDVAAAEADIEAQAMQAYIDQYNANRQYALSQAQLTGSLGDTRTLAGQEFDYSKSSSNPAVQAAILANRAQELNNAAREIENSFLPDTLKLQAQRLKQQVEAGALDYDTALAQLNQIKRQATGGSGGGGLTSWQQYQMGRNSQQDAAAAQKDLYDRAMEMAKADPRLGMPDDNSTNTLSQLVDAYLKMLQSQAGGGTYTDEYLMGL